ncbi:MAG: hypothetical protein M3Y81_28750, partial [Chloroflexota bacterium]|nr:hypothetical protein [Chloroflexota bacterium]
NAPTSPFLDGTTREMEQDAHHVGTDAARLTGNVGAFPCGRPGTLRVACQTTRACDFRHVPIQRLE